MSEKDTTKKTDLNPDKQTAEPIAHHNATVGGHKAVARIEAVLAAVVVVVLAVIITTVIRLFVQTVK